MKKTLLLPLMFLTILGLPTQVLAHAIETNYAFDLELSEKLDLKTTFSTGEPLQEAKVIVYAPNNPSEPWLETTTDENGNFSFTPDTSIPGDWEVQIIKDEGHEDYLTIPVSNKGIEVQNISQKMNRDVHFASIPLNPLATTMVIAGTGATVFLLRRKFVN
ncbi:conserved hypothetical protein [Gloeothece citriformis PCC 7424]|uniref:Carboxypeptidase regulatory-like domain-containing protein n=1 Tax=Gloeothece citriformis (strain PCC 7424) TaxID=65393 RepID=B7KIJ0_GLOC7|nr:carboxypeptidase-like regulatory domain-containing protein [Gloeothece citriformis]ACK69396.1 conserved hypothetical protein [Gloeothece citriformis PCC 7424]